MPKIARVDDEISHGGPITTGAVSKFANGKKIARLGDHVLCNQHGDQTIVSASTDVFAESQGVARVGDRISCGATITTGSPNVFVNGMTRMQPVVQAILPPNKFGGPLEVYDEVGQRISTAGTTTSGIQEAINYAVPQGFPLKVFGQGWKGDTLASLASSGASAIIVNNPSRWLFGDQIAIIQNSGATVAAITDVTGSVLTLSAPLSGDANSGNRIYSLGALSTTASIIIPPCQIADIELVNVQLTMIPANPSDEGIKIDSCNLFKYRATNCNLIYQGTGACYHLAPTNPDPVDGNKVINADVDFGWIALQGGAGGAVGIKFDIAGGTINRSFFRCGQINAFGGAGAYGVLIDGSQFSGATAFEDNNLELMIDGEFSLAAFSEGTTLANQSLYLRNNYNVVANQQAAADAIRSYGKANVWLARVPGEASTYTHSMVLEPGSTLNQGYVLYAGGSASPVFVDNGTANAVNPVGS